MTPRGLVSSWLSAATSPLPVPLSFFLNKPGRRAADYIKKERATQIGWQPNNKKQQRAVELGHQRADNSTQVWVIGLGRQPTPATLLK
jgi:hypothetical protein